MFKRLFAVVVLTSLFATLPVAADDHRPKIAILRLGPLPSIEITEGAILDVLESYGFISAEENRIVEARRDHEGENIHFIWGDAGFDFPTVNLMIEDALDNEADVLLTIGTAATLVAVSVTADMDEPPAVLFTAVHNPYESGIAESSCIKPDHATGAEIETSYEYVFAALLLQNPDMKKIGTIYSTAEASGVYGADQIASHAAEQGMTVKAAGVTRLADLLFAAAGLVEAGAEAIVLPIDSLATQGLPIIVAVANENGVPVFHPSLGSIDYGATVGAGFSRFYESGVNVARLLVGHLNGDIEIATTGIHVASDTALGINLDSAKLQGVDVSSELMREADVVLEGGASTRVSRRVMQRIRQRGVIIPLEDRLEDDMEFLANLQCTEEMIAEQQAELDAASE